MPPFNLNTISSGINTADFYLAVPTAVVKFLESDQHTKLLAKPQLRGAEGAKLTFKTGNQIPVISTTFLPVATGGAGQNPLASYTYKDVGITLEITPRFSPEGDILLDLMIDDSSQGASQTVAGTPNVPTFQQRTITTRLRLRDGESNLLAGLIQDNDTRNVTGFPGVIHVPFLSDALSGNVQQQDQTDIVILLTPHIVRGSDVTESDSRRSTSLAADVQCRRPAAAAGDAARRHAGRGSGSVNPGIANAGGRSADTARHDHGARRLAGSGNRRRAESAGAGYTAGAAAGCRAAGRAADRRGAAGARGIDGF